jgi:AraC-like DNA-binding protein
MFSNNNQLNEILGKIYLNYYENQEENRWFLKAYIYELIAFLYSKSFITPLMTYSLNIAKIEPIVRYIDNNFKLPITLEDICNEVKYSKYFICHNFKAITGSTIFEYINFLRVLYAVERLKLKNSTISDIAIESGFSSVTYFDRVFRNIIGCSPSVYRKNF